MRLAGHAEAELRQDPALEERPPLTAPVECTLNRQAPRVIAEASTIHVQPYAGDVRHVRKPQLDPLATLLTLAREPARSTDAVERAPERGWIVRRRSDEGIRRDGSPGGIERHRRWHGKRAQLCDRHVAEADDARHPGRVAQRGDEREPGRRVGEEQPVNDDRPESQRARHVEGVVETSELEEWRPAGQGLQRRRVAAVSIQNAVTMGQRAVEVSGSDGHAADGQFERGAIRLPAKPLVRGPSGSHVGRRERAHIDRAGVPFGHQHAHRAAGCGTTPTPWRGRREPGEPDAASTASASVTTTASRAGTRSPPSPGTTSSSQAYGPGNGSVKLNLSSGPVPARV